ncbi:MAG: hypothetical protein KIT74_09250 [Fimbriimonadales bacterium]|nr:hypothetical protein [Fimbriimonadales bacterium]
MIALFALSATLFGYTLPSDPVRYSVELNYDGYLPVLGGLEQTAKVNIGLVVSGRTDGIATTQLETLSVALRDLENGGWAVLPFNEESVRPFFPTSTIRFEKSGRILETDMPKNELPMRLPGLDLQHIPDVTFMFLEFPEQEIEEGHKWSFERKFGASLVKYHAEYLGTDEKGAKFGVQLTQEYEVKEDENNNPTTDEAEVAQVVKTKVEGGGTVWFKGPKGLISAVEVTANAVSHVYSMKAGDPVGQRRLRTQFKIEYLGPKS